MKRIMILTLTAALVGAPLVAFARCTADVDVGRSWEENGGFVQKARLRATVTRARPGAFATVHVEARFHYERSDGWTNAASASASTGIDTSQTSSEDFLIDTRAINCSREKRCEIKDVEIFRVSCYD